MANNTSGAIRNFRNGTLARFAQWAPTYALAFIFLVFGATKFTPMAGAKIAPLISNSPFIFWWHDVFGVHGTALVLGSFEILTGLLIAARPVKPHLSVVGGAMAVLTFLTTLSFLFSTPNVTAGDAIFPLATLGQFLLKDLVLLAVSLAIFNNSLDEVSAGR